MDDHHSNLSIKSEEDEDTRFIDNDSDNLFFGAYTNNEDNETKNRELFNLLKNWNQLELFDHFKNEQIDLEVLAAIKPHFFQRLLEPFGLRTHIMFEHNLEQWRELIGFPLPKYRDAPSSFGPIRCGKNSFSKSCQHIGNSNPTTSNSSNPSSSLNGITPLTNNSETETRTRVNLDTILKSSIKGQMLIDLYNINNKFEEAQRTLLIHLIAEYFNDKGIHLELAATYNIEKDIISKFPSEQLEYYRTSKRGRIYNKFCNYKYSLTRVARSSNTKFSTATTPDEAHPISELVPEEDAEVHISSLNNKKLSENQIETSWKACTNYRINEIRGLKSITLILTKWPQYRALDGHKYIAMDFKYLHSNWNSLVDNWDSVSEKLFKFLSAGQSIRNQEIRIVLNNIKTTDSKDCRDAGLLWCLHGYLKPTCTISGTNEKGGRSMSKISIKDSQDSFVYVAKSIQDIETHRQNLNQQYSSIYPFIAVLGTDIVNFSKIFVCLEDIKYSFDNFISALDVCYNIIALFKLEYPTACPAIWSFIQMFFFDSKPETRFPRVHVLINELKDK